MNYYQHHIGDFIRDTARLSDSQCMAYLRLIWVYYETEQPIENDVDAVAFKIGASASDVGQILKHFFFLHDDGLWHQARCDKEILAFREKSDKAKKSADARWKNANAMRTHSERNADEHDSDANQEPRTNNQKPIEKESVSQAKPGKRKNKSRLPSDFDLSAERIELAREYWLTKNRSDLDATTEFQKFINYHTANGTSMADWDAAWRTWYCNAVTFNKPIFGVVSNENPRTVAEHRLAVSRATNDYDQAIDF